ncbi:sulfotransferase [Phenylobacterium sp.]|uniref:tetratricopeptide repeat-containing sulfotransferase family protein n=1 Tax=Phenylobacterium sp. TaxID=1871053 RepID=UPI003564673A
MTEFSSGPISLSFGGRKRDPEADRARLRAIHTTLQAGDVAAAADMAEAALAEGLEHPMLFNLAADRPEREGRFEDALALLERGHAFAPQDIGLRQALGLCLHRLERYAAAVPHFDAVIAAQPAMAPAHAARGAALEVMGDIRGAEAAYDRAVALDPRSLAALSGLASLASRRGRHAEARALAEQVVAGQPDYPDALMVLAQADLAERRFADGEARLRRLIADPRATPVQQALANGLIGDILDAQDATAEAFAAYRACNDGLRSAYASRFAAGPSALDQARETVALLDSMPASSWASGPQPPSGTARSHVFLVGFPRSGTTLLEQVLASHPDVEALEERDTLADAIEAYGRQPRDLAALAQAPQSEITRLRAAYWQRVSREGARPAGKVFVDKLPLNTFRLPMIAKLFPEAKVLFARRDPRDVVLSAFRRRFAMNAPMYQLLTLPSAAGFYDAAMQVGERLDDLGLSTLVVRHERLVEAFDAVAGEVCGFLDLPFTEALRGFADRVQDRGVATPSGAQISRGLTAEGIGAWRRYAGEMAGVLPVLQPWIERFGYPAD